MSTETPERKTDLYELMTRPRVRAVLIFGFWTFFGGLLAGESYAHRWLAGQPLPFYRTLVPALAWAYTWALFTPLVLRLRKRFRFSRGNWKAPLAVHLPISLVFAFAGSLVFISGAQFVGNLPGGTSVLLERSFRLFVAYLHMDPFLYWIILGLGYLGEHFESTRKQQIRAAQLETQLAEARLKALEMQLHPHFLFNALHTIAVLVRTKRNAQAVRVVTGLAELLRRVLDEAGMQVVPLKQEIQFIERYLEIEQIRIGDRLKVDMDVEPDTLTARVPHLILQPLVENAIRHGIAPNVSAEHLEITARRQGEYLALTVSDDGPGLSGNGGGADAAGASGVGLSTTRERLRELYGDRHSFEIRENGPEGGVTAELVIPFERAPDELRGEG